MGHVAFFLLFYLVAAVSSLLTAATRARRAAGIAISTTALPLGFLAPAEPAVVRFLLALGSILLVARVVELAQTDGLSRWRRLWHAVGVVDTRRVKVSMPAVNRGALLRVFAYGLLTAAAGWLVWYRAHGEPGYSYSYYALRWGGAILLAYASFEVTVSAVRVTYGLCGVYPLPLHRDPILSKTVSEFWGQRWNLLVHRYLKQNFFRPIARRGFVLFGLLGAFVASSLLHFFITVAAVGIMLGSMMAVFFLVQIAFIVVERWFRVARWPAPLARVWTVGVIVAASPLFTEPILRVLGSPMSP